jgi:hypothetical protein
MRTTQFLTIALVGLFAFTTIGCGGHPDRANYATVTGTVTYKGQPVDGATVSFISTDAGNSDHGGTVTDARGNFTMRSAGAAARNLTGMPPGKYIVTIRKVETPPDPNEAANRQQEDAYERGELSDAQIDALRRARPPSPPSIHLIPQKYGDQRTTTLEATVEKGRSNTFTFELED